MKYITSPKERAKLAQNIRKRGWSMDLAARQSLHAAIMALPASNIIWHRQDSGFRRIFGYAPPRAGDTASWNKDGAARQVAFTYGGDVEYLIMEVAMGVLEIRQRPAKRSESSLSLSEHPSQV
jgi:hypothetical protein